MTSTMPLQLQRSLGVLLLCSVLCWPVIADTIEGDPVEGERIFRSCRPCHSLEPGTHRVGASLYNLFGTVGGSADGFAYSSAMEERKPLWDATTIDAWTADPRGFMPGTKMPFAGIPDAQRRADLIAFLRIATAPKPALSPTSVSDAEEVTFGDHVEPILRTYCHGCHGHGDQLTAQQLSGVLLTDYEEVMMGGTNGPIVVPGRPAVSPLLRFLDGSTHFTSPRSHEVSLIEKWIAAGANRGRTDRHGPNQKERIVVADVQLNAPKYVACISKRSRAFLHLVVERQSDGQIVYVDWDSVESGEAATWRLPGLRGSDEAFTLSIFPTTGDQTAEGTIFVFSDDEIPQDMLEKYGSNWAFIDNPIDLSSTTEGELQLWLEKDSNVEVSIAYDSGQGLVEKMSEKYGDLPKGPNRIPMRLIDETMKPFDPGEYIVDVTYEPVDRGGYAKRIALLLRAQ